MTKWYFRGGSEISEVRLDASSDDETGAVSGKLSVEFKDFAVSGYWGWSPDRRNKDAAITLLGTCNDAETIFVTLSGSVDEDLQSFECVIGLSYTNEDDRMIGLDMDDRHHFEERDWSPLVQVIKCRMYDPYALG